MFSGGLAAVLSTAAVWCVPFSGAVGLFNKLQSKKTFITVMPKYPVRVTTMLSRAAYQGLWVEETRKTRTQTLQVCGVEGSRPQPLTQASAL